MISVVKHAVVLVSFSRQIQPVRGTKAVQVAVSSQAWRTGKVEGMRKFSPNVNIDSYAASILRILVDSPYCQFNPAKKKSVPVESWLLWDKGAAFSKVLDTHAVIVYDSGTPSNSFPLCLT